MGSEIATPSGGSIEEVLDALLERVRGLLAAEFTDLEAVAAEVVRRRRAVRAGGGVFGVSDLAGIKPVIIERLTAHPEADGLGFLAAPRLLAGRERHIEWWQRGVAGFVPLRLNLDPTCVDVYDYFEMEWFAAAYRGRRAVFGPYVDYSGADRYVCTVTVPVADETFLGVVGTDLPMSALEPRLLSVLRDADRDVVLVNAERRVVAANCSRWLVGSKLPHVPRAGDGEFLASGEVELDSGWVLALAARG